MNTSIIYWVSTVLISLLSLWTGYSYLFNPSMIKAGKELGFPGYLLTQLAIMNILAAIILLIPYVPIRYKEWAHIGIGLFIITSIVAHIAHKDPLAITLINIVFLALLIVANTFMYRL